MGSNNSWYIDVNTDDKQQIHAIIAEGRRIDDPTGDSSDEYWDVYCFRKWSQSTKWSPIDLLRKLSRVFKKHFFLLKCSGESGPNEWFYLDGLSLPKSLVFPKPKYPRMTEWKAAIHRKEALARQMQEEQAVREQVKIDEEIAYLKARLAEKEAALEKRGKR